MKRVESSDVFAFSQLSMGKVDVISVCFGARKCFLNTSVKNFEKYFLSENKFLENEENDFPNGSTSTENEFL